MNLQNFKPNLGWLVTMVILFLLVSSPIVAQQGARISGRVVDELGSHVSNTSVVVLPQGEMGGPPQIGVLPLRQTWTDAEGRFSLTNIGQESLTLIVGDRDNEMEVLSIEIGKLSLYPIRHPHFGKIRFSLEPGTEIGNVVITVKWETKPQIRARVVFADRTPLANAPIYRVLRHEDLDGSGSGMSTGAADTDADGYFVEDLDEEDDLGFYVLGVEYDGLVAKSVPFMRYEGQPQVHLLLTLNGNPNPLTQRMPGPIEMGAALAKFLNPPAVWVVNPANQHAYKQIETRGITDAIAQATAENAYLVAINNVSEAHWIQKIFGRKQFWIGLNDVAEEGRWAWDSGEPVTYTNWDRYGIEGGNTKTKDYVIVEFSGQWQAVEAENPRTRRITKAILEKAATPVKIPAADNSRTSKEN